LVITFEIPYLKCIVSFSPPPLLPPPPGGTDVEASETSGGKDDQSVTKPPSLF